MNAAVISAEAADFAVRHGIAESLSQALHLASQCLPLAGPPRVTLDYDPDSDFESLTIEAPVFGEPKAVAAAHWKFAAEAAPTLGRARERITLICVFS